MKDTNIHESAEFLLLCTTLWIQVQLLRLWLEGRYWD